MPSPQYISMTSRGRKKSFSENRKRSDLISGGVPLLLNRIIKEPIKGGAIVVKRRRIIKLYSKIKIWKRDKETVRPKYKVSLLI